MFDTQLRARAFLCIQMTILINSQAVAKHKLLRGNAKIQMQVGISCVNARDINTFRIIFQFIRSLYVISRDLFRSHFIIFAYENIEHIKLVVIACMRVQTKKPMIFHAKKLYSV